MPFYTETYEAARRCLPSAIALSFLVLYQGSEQIKIHQFCQIRPVTVR